MVVELKRFSKEEENGDKEEGIVKNKWCFEFECLMEDKENYYYNK